MDSFTFYTAYRVNRKTIYGVQVVEALESSLAGISCGFIAWVS